MEEETGGRKKIQQHTCNMGYKGSILTVIHRIASGFGQTLNLVSSAVYKNVHVHETLWCMYNCTSLPYMYKNNTYRYTLVYLYVCKYEQLCLHVHVHMGFRCLCRIHTNEASILKFRVNVSLVFLAKLVTKVSDDGVHQHHRNVGKTWS